MESLSMIWVWITSFLSPCPLPTSNLFVDGPTQTLFTCTCCPQRTYSRIFQPGCIPHMRKWEQVRRFRHLIGCVAEPSALENYVKSRPEKKGNGGNLDQISGLQRRIRQQRLWLVWEEGRDHGSAWRGWQASTVKVLQYAALKFDVGNTFFNNSNMIYLGDLG
jgi:hypothetical protein